MTPPSLRALLSHILDYAGLFPPARLPLEEAIANYARYRNEPEAWILARFILPTRLMARLTPEQLQDGPRFVFSALGRGGDDRESFLAGIAEDAEAMAQFRARHPGRVAITLFEVRWPSRLLAQGDVAALAQLVAETRQVLGENLSLFWEIPHHPAWDAWMPLAVEALARDGHAGFKLRCGGVEPQMFPSIEQVARTLLACRDAGVPLKCTAGLHHPLRHFNEGMQTMMHGFINIFGGGVLAHVHGLDQTTLASILAEEAPTAFTWDEDGFAWRGLYTPIDAIHRVRAQRLISFGSCSFDEPRADLRALGWL